jgi:telomerase reverse transcriptase
VIWKYLGRAQATGDVCTFSSGIEKDAAGKQGTVFVDSVVQRRETHDKLLSLLSEHIERNIVQIGTKHYRQKTGIPQGSIVSSLLCSFFYAELEKEVLNFLDPSQSVLLRLIDDFLLISTDREAATRFVHTMHAGIPEYGLSIKREKSRVNFDVQVDGVAIARFPAVTDFPYCGNAINTVDLHISRDETRRQRNSTLVL